MRSAIDLESLPLHQPVKPLIIAESNEIVAAQVEDTFVSLRWRRFFWFAALCSVVGVCMLLFGMSATIIFSWQKRDMNLVYGSIALFSPMGIVLLKKFVPYNLTILRKRWYLNKMRNERDEIFVLERRVRLRRMAAMERGEEQEAIEIIVPEIEQVVTPPIPFEYPTEPGAQSGPGPLYNLQGVANAQSGTSCVLEAYDGQQPLHIKYLEKFGPSQSNHGNYFYGGELPQMLQQYVKDTNDLVLNTTDSDPKIGFPLKSIKPSPQMLETTKTNLLLEGPVTSGNEALITPSTVQPDTEEPVMDNVMIEMKRSRRAVYKGHTRKPRQIKPQIKRKPIPPVKPPRNIGFIVPFDKSKNDSTPAPTSHLHLVSN